MPLDDFSKNVFDFSKEASKSLGWASFIMDTGKAFANPSMKNLRDALYSGYSLHDPMGGLILQTYALFIDNFTSLSEPDNYIIIGNDFLGQRKRFGGW